MVLAQADAPVNLRPYLFHGLELSMGDREAVGDCPWCGKSRHLFISVSEGQWQCKVCGEQGNAYVFLRTLHRRSLADTPDHAYADLAQDRGVTVATLRR